MQSRVIRRLALAAVVAVGVSTMTACASHHRVVDTANGTTYYTKGVKHHRSGSVTFRDGKSDRDVTLDSFQIEKISKKEYKDGLEGGSGG